MKKKLFLDEDLDAFLSESAEEIRMYPSDRVWRNINRDLHGDKHWPALTFGAVLTGAIIIASLIFLQPDKDLFEVKVPQMGMASKKPATAPESVSANHNTKETTNSSSAFSPSANAAFSSYSMAEKPLLNEPADKAALNEETPETALLANTDASISNAVISLNDEAFNAGSSLSLQNADAYAGEMKETAESNLDPSETEKYSAYTSGIVSLESELNAKAAAAQLQQLRNNSKRWSVQYYVTPSLSYRMLSADRQFNYGSNAVNLPAISTMVNHNAQLGIEGGMAFLYKLSDNVNLKAGLQLNYRQYVIDAYRLPVQQTVVLRLNGADSVVTRSNISNMGGAVPVEVTNHSFQVGLPVGFEMAFAELKNSKLFVSATFQPTYIIGQQAWMLSSDYTNYVKQPELTRKWNFNTGVEAFVRFKTKGGLNWQVGPQIRYQMLPVAVSRYPVREHLIDYGFKIGIGKAF